MLSSKISQSNTGIGQPINSSTVSTVTTGTSSVNSTAGLEKGQIIKGEVVDLRSDEVSVKLDDGRLLSGKLENSADLAIGQKVTFRVEDVSLKSLTLKIVADGQYNLPDTTIDKALDAAGLSKNSRNRAIVTELLNQHMSIDKKMISNLIQQSIVHKDCPINTLVLMNKYHIPINDSNVSQFEAYRNGDYSMINEIGKLTDSISDLFQQLSNTSSEQINQNGSEILKLILTNNTNNEAPSVSQNTGFVMDSSVTMIPTESLLSQEDAVNLTKLLSSLSTADTPISQAFIDSIKNGTADLRDVAHIVNQLLNNQKLSPSSSVESAFSSGAATVSLEAMRNTGNSNGLTQTAIDAIVEGLPAANTIISAYQDLQYTNNELGSFLQAMERMKLLKSLDFFSLPPEVHQQIETGDISSHALLTLIHEKLGSVPEASIKNLFASKEYQSLIKEELAAKWTFKPDSLTKENIVERHFENLSHELKDFMSYMERASGSTSETVSQQANHLQENINFMKTLNDLFTYVQLPLKLHNQSAHGELYVYTKKREGRSAKDGISVLLHLNMDHLGPIDIHIDLHHNNVVSKFYLSKEDTIELISSNLPVLEQALQKKGYSLNAEILERKKEVDIVEDFINPDSTSQSVTRYNFDIRA